ncbi:MAG: NHL repeat-containing protein, partial [Nitrospiraceae bacterium]
ITATIQRGTIATIAGNGEPGHAGDNGSAVEACLNEPKSLALDGKGNLYIADAENHVIRRVDLASGLITTVAGRPEKGNGASGPARSHAPAEDEDPFADPSTSKSEKFVQLADLSGTVRYVVGAGKAGRFGGDGGPATQAMLNFPGAVAADRQGNLYIADTMNHRIRKVDTATGVIATIAGTGQHRSSGDGGPATAAALNEPAALAVDDRGNLYIADQSNNRVRKVDLNTGTITTVAGTGETGYTGDGMPATEAGLSGPSGLAIGPDGALYIADTFSGRIRRIDPATGLISTVAGDGGEYRFSGLPNEFSTSLSRPYGIALDGAGNLLITDSDSHLLRRWDRKKKIITRMAGSGQAQFGGDGGDPLNGSLNYPFGVVVDGAGNVYIADTFNHRIRMIAA